MTNATHNRISRLLPLVVLVGQVSPASTISAVVNGGFAIVRKEVF